MEFLGGWMGMCDRWDIVLFVSGIMGSCKWEELLIVFGREPCLTRK